MSSKEEKAIRLLQYLRNFTDERNPTSMPLIDYYFRKKGVPDFFGPENSRRKNKRQLVKELVRILNSDINGNPLPREEWRIMYDGCGEEDTKKRHFICNLYYRQPFSRDDISDIIKSIEKNDSLPDEQKKSLTEKVRRYVSTKNYNSNECYLIYGMDPVEKKKLFKRRYDTESYIDYIIRTKKAAADDDYYYD